MCLYRRERERDRNRDLARGQRKAEEKENGEAEEEKGVGRWRKGCAQPKLAARRIISTRKEKREYVVSLYTEEEKNGKIMSSILFGDENFPLSFLNLNLNRPKYS